MPKVILRLKDVAVFPQIATALGVPTIHGATSVIPPTDAFPYPYTVGSRSSYAVRQRLADYLESLCEAYQNVEVESVLFANECFRTDGQLRNNYFYQERGDRWIADAYDIAKSLWPHAQLIYNDFAPHSDKLWRSVEQYLDHWNIDCYIGVQYHQFPIFNSSLWHCGFNRLRRRVNALNRPAVLSEVTIWDNNNDRRLQNYRRLLTLPVESICYWCPTPDLNWHWHYGKNTPARSWIVDV